MNWNNEHEMQQDELADKQHESYLEQKAEELINKIGIDQEQIQMHLNIRRNEGAVADILIGSIQFTEALKSVTIDAKGVKEKAYELVLNRIHAYKEKQRVAQYEASILQTLNYKRGNDLKIVMLMQQCIDSNMDVDASVSYILEEMKDKIREDEKDIFMSYLTDKIRYEIVKKKKAS